MLGPTVLISAKFRNLSKRQRMVSGIHLMHLILYESDNEIIINRTSNTSIRKNDARQSKSVVFFSTNKLDPIFVTSEILKDRKKTILRNIIINTTHTEYT